jgi:hypothetical protein
MQAILIVELKIRFQPSFCVRDRLIILEIHLLILNASPESFDENIVQSSPAAIPTDANPCCLEATSKIHTGKLRSLVGVKNLRSRLLKCLVEGFETKRGFQGDRSSPSEYVATEPVNDGDQIQESSLQADVGNIRTPDLIDAIDAQSTRAYTDTAPVALLVDSTEGWDRSP